MIRIPPRSGRRAYTLLELMLAMAIGVLFLAALFAAMQLQLRHVQAGRDVTEHSALARAVLARISNDIVHSLTPPAPAFYSGPSGPPTSGGSGSGSASNSSIPASATANSQFQFDFGLRGEQSQLTLFTCGLPPEPDPQRKDLGGDLRFITYWLAKGGQGRSGLARLEHTRVTADVAGQLPSPGSADEAACVIAEEVTSLEFRYFGRSGWASTWDATQTGPDWLTLIGPPRAVEITLSMTMPREYGRPTVQPEVRVFRHVVAVPAAQR